MKTPKRLEVVYIVPSHYDDDGYVHRYRWGVIPSNTLACLRSMTRAIAAKNGLGDDVEITVTTYDDNVQRVPMRKIIARSRKPDVQLVAGLVGVQSNQFARAADLALELRKGGVQTMIGGFHVSGMLAMFDEPTPDLRPLLDAGVSLVKGEIEGPGVLDGILRDALMGELRPIYDIATPPDLTNAAVPEADPEYLKHFLLSRLGTIDTSRGCPFDCTFCTIINVQGRRMRCRSAEKVLAGIQANYDNGVRDYFFTDDNIARSAIWEEVFDGLAEMRARGVNVHFMMQVDTRAHTIPRFAEKAGKAGCHCAFIGMESVNPRNLEATGKKQNDTDDYPAMVDHWHSAGVRVHVGYIIGLPHDTPDSVEEDVILLRDHVKVDQASFFMLTPLPGSKDHMDMVKNGIPMDADYNNFDSNHETFRHPNFAPGKWKKAYHDAWSRFYNKDNTLSVLLRAPRSEYWGLFWTFMWYRWSGVFVQTHPMGTGLFRLKDRLARRSIFTRENPFQYTWRRLRDVAWGLKVYAQISLEFQEVWMLTRRPDDARWATLADLRDRWTAARLRITAVEVRERYDAAATEVREHYDAAAEEVRAMLANAVSSLRVLSAEGQGMKRRMRTRIEHKASEVEAYLRSFEMQMPTLTPETLNDAKLYIHDSVLGGYEEMAIRYVATRRKINAYRSELIAKLREGNLVSWKWLRLPRIAFMETIFALRFWYSMITQGV